MHNITIFQLLKLVPLFCSSLTRVRYNKMPASNGGARLKQNFVKGNESTSKSFAIPSLNYLLTTHFETDHYAWVPTYNYDKQYTKDKP